MINTVIGLTGPTGAGKSTWAGAFRALGCAVIDCDALARQVTESPAVQGALRAAFGEDVVRAGALDRRLLAARAFADAKSAARLNAITHPAIRAQLRRELDAAERAGARAAVIDAPLLFEGGIAGLCTVTAAVLAPPEVRLARILARDGITAEEARRRMGRQHGEAYFREHAGAVLDGTLPPGQIPDAARRLLEQWSGGAL